MTRSSLTASRPWLNPNAPANWLADVEKWREAFQVTSEHLSYEMGPGTWKALMRMLGLGDTLMVTIKGQKPPLGTARSPIRFQSTARCGRLTRRRGAHVVRSARPRPWARAEARARLSEKPGRTSERGKTAALVRREHGPLHSRREGLASRSRRAPPDRRRGCPASKRCAGSSRAMDATLGRGSQALTKWIEDFKWGRSSNLRISVSCDLIPQT